MLTFLAIRDFAIIDRLEVEFGSGFVVVTGETGAGKSILVNALHLLMGGRATEEMIRTDADSAEVQAVFVLSAGSATVAKLEELGLREGDSLTIRRVLSRTGRNRVFVNDRAVKLSSLAALTRALVDISGQHEHVSLTDEDSHRDILDAFGELTQMRNGVSQAVREWREVGRMFADVQRAERQRVEREDYLLFTLERIEQVDPQPGEDESLEEERLRLANAERLAEGLSKAAGLLYEQDRSAIDLVGQAVKQLEGIVRFDPSLQAAITSLTGNLRAIEDQARELSVKASTAEGDPERLEQVEQRLSALRSLLRTHGPTMESLLERRAAMDAELSDLKQLESKKAELGENCQRAFENALELARDLSQARQGIASGLAERLGVELASLSMPAARLEVSVEPGEDEDMDEGGLDQVRFLFSANSGEQVRPLALVASGGELSRVLLALKSVLAEVDPVPVYVFDEVDSGVGGAVAEVIGARLKAVAEGHQVFCITHLPQIAAQAQSHFSVRKQERSGRTVSQIVELGTRAERVEEIARMVGGVTVSDQARGHARDLLARGRG